MFPALCFDDIGVNFIEFTKFSNKAAILLLKIWSQYSTLPVVRINYKKCLIKKLIFFFFLFFNRQHYDMAPGFDWELFIYQRKIIRNKLKQEYDKFFFLFSGP